MIRNVYRKRSFFGKLMLLPFLFIVSFVFAMFQGGFVSWFLFYGFLPFVLYPVLLLFYPLKSIQVHRKLMQREYKAGQELLVEVTIQRNNRFPLLFLIIEDVLPSAFLKQNETKKQVVFLFFRKECTYTYTIRQAVRGEHHFRTFQLITGDLLGFYTKKQEVACQQTVLVYPAYKKIPYVQFASLFDQGLHASNVKKQEVTSIVSGVRHYIPGDRLSSIHWKATAKKNEMMTKEFEVRKSQDVYMILDQSPSVLFEEMVIWTASLLDAALDKGISISFATSHRSLGASSYGKGEGQRQRILYELAKVTEAEQPNGLLANHFRKNGETIYLIITSRLHEEMISSLSMLRGKNTVMVIYLMKDATLDAIQEKFMMEAKSRGVSFKLLTSDLWTSLIKGGVS